MKNNVRFCNKRSAGGLQVVGKRPATTKQTGSPSVADFLFPRWECFIPKVGMIYSQAGNFCSLGREQILLRQGALCAGSDDDDSDDKNRSVSSVSSSAKIKSMLDGESAEGVAVACQFAVDVNTKALASMVTRAVLVPDDGEVVAMIEHIVEAEIIPFILR